MEGMWVYLRYAAYYMPQTLAVDALRHVFLRGIKIQTKILTRKKIYKSFPIFI
jgi:hypothetical protein